MLEPRVLQKRDGLPAEEGFCECGCGEKAPIASQTQRRFGWLKGKPMRFVRGHSMRTMTRPPLGEDDYTVVDRGFETPCWIRKGGLTSTGYGRVSFGGKSQYAHRAMYEQEVGPIPEGFTIDHLCRQRDCINPSHLEPVTQAENNRRGALTKLSEDDVIAIRTAPSSVMTKDLASSFGISDSHASRVRRSEKWSQIG